MILQRNQPVPVWGIADPGTQVTVEFAGQKKTTVADSSKHWEITLDSISASSVGRPFQVSGFKFHTPMYSLETSGSLHRSVEQGGLDEALPDLGSGQ